MSNARETLESRGHKVTKKDGGFFVKDPRGFEQGPWDESQLTGWAHAVEDSPQLEVVKAPKATAVTKPPAKASPKKS